MKTDTMCVQNSCTPTEASALNLPKLRQRRCRRAWKMKNRLGAGSCDNGRAGRVHCGGRGVEATGAISRPFVGSDTATWQKVKSRETILSKFFFEPTAGSINHCVSALSPTTSRDDVGFGVPKCQRGARLYGRLRLRVKHFLSLCAILSQSPCMPIEESRCTTNFQLNSPRSPSRF